jgi:hypothetical protein
MKDIISRLTFGFLMAQVFPGALAAFALTFAHASIEHELPNSGLLGAVGHVLDLWAKAGIAEVLFLLGLCIGLGMFIHGVHWAVLGSLERDSEKQQLKGIFDLDWHRRLIWQQFLSAPFRLVYETIRLFWRDVQDVAIEENVADIDDQRMKQHEFMQDFYLYPAQFFAHTAFALEMCFGALCTFNVIYSWTWRRFVVLTLIYVTLCAFFVLARVQLCALFNAERKLIDASKQPE